jgi:hypothetical protein
MDYWGDGGAVRMSPVDKVRSELEELAAEAARLRARLEEIDTEISERHSFIRIWERVAATAGDAAPPESDPQPQTSLPATPSTPTTAGDSLHGKGLSAAAALILRRERRNMRLAEITRALIQHGVKFAARKPEMSVDWALKRAAETGHAVKVARGLWSAAPCDGLPQDGLPKGDHSAQTRAGLALAKERGVRLGPPGKITEEHRQLAVSLFEQGESVVTIAKRCGVSRTAMDMRIKRWRREGLFPPKTNAGATEQADPERGMVH